ncbi:MAG: hypothetical protein QNJ00_16725 [Woeseiaceae bacterium]|nr:hypothetical protein [Woeseiaceae bacterium]
MQDLSSWPTKRLLGRLNALRRLVESPSQSDLEPSEIRRGAEIQFKSDPRWSNAYKDLKSILDKRENVRSGRADRLARIKEGRR